MKVLLFVSLICCCSSLARAEVYEYKDASGRSVFVDSQEKVPEEFREQTQSPKELAPISRVPKSPYAQAQAQQQGAGAGVRGSSPQKKVDIFVTTWCPHCKTLEKFLSQQRIKFKRYDIERDTMGRAEYQRLGGGGVPMIRIGEKVLRGFSAEQISRELQAR
jgi:glutaredoxin